MTHHNVTVDLTPNQNLSLVSSLFVIQMKSLIILLTISLTHQLCPRYEGQLMLDGGAYSPFRSILLVLTHDNIITHVFGPTGSEGHEWLNDADAGCAPFSLPFVAKGWCKSRAPCNHLIWPPTRTTTG